MAIKASKQAAQEGQQAPAYQITPSSRGAGRLESQHGKCVSCGGSGAVSGMHDTTPRACPFC